MSSPFPIYPPASGAYYWQRLGTVIGVAALVFTAHAAFTAPPCVQADGLLLLAALWGIVPPFWWWIEFFFVYPKHHTEEKFELVKLAAQASLAIWLPIAAALAAYASSDYFKPPGNPPQCLYLPRGT
jgi:hypothetical protein